MGQHGQASGPRTRLRRPSMLDASMTVLSGEQPAARVQRLYKAGPRTPRPHTPVDETTADHTSTHHDWPLALQPEDQARWRDIWIGLAGPRQAPDASTVSATSVACARAAATIGSTPRPERGEATASTAAPARPCLRAGHACPSALRRRRTHPFAGRNPSGVVAPHQPPCAHAAHPV
jgi:hypothetical protein